MDTFEKNYSTENDSYTEAEKQKFLDNLRLVGKTKSLGYLPMSTLIKICGVDPKIIRKELEEKGLVVIELTRKESGVDIWGVLYAYDRESLSRILQMGRSVLERNGWPTEPDEFVRHLAVDAEDPDLYNLIMKAFTDISL